MTRISIPQQQPAVTCLGSHFSVSICLLSQLKAKPQDAALTPALSHVPPVRLHTSKITGQGQGCAMRDLERTKCISTNE